MSTKKITKKKNINVVFIGHVDAGKSTISGHLMFDVGDLDDRLLEKFEREAKALNRESWKYAFAMDTAEEERERGKTVDVGRASFETINRRCTILDAPGHKGFVHHMITGAAQGDVAVLVISARKGEYETGFSGGGQTREHALIAYVCGIKQVIVVINKMDDETVKWSKKRYDLIEHQISGFLKEVGFSLKNVQFMPVSGYTGANLTGPIDPHVCTWYEGPTFMDAIDTVKLPKRDVKTAFRLPVAGKYKEVGSVLLGKVETGKVRPGDAVIVMPARVKTTVAEIQDEAGDVMKSARAGDNVRLRLRDDLGTHVDMGSVVCPVEHPIGTGREFVARFILVDYPSVITAGFKCIMHSHAATQEVTVSRILAILDPRTGKIKEGGMRPKFIKPGQHAMIRVQTSHSVCLTPFTELEKFGRFLLRHESLTLGIGVVTKLK